MQTLSWGWPLWLYAVNAVAVFLFYGAFELHLYVLKRQERRFKYNGKFPSEQKSKAFWFESQNLDNILRTFLSGVTIWTAVEVLVLWAFANGYAPWLSFAEHPGLPGGARPGGADHPRVPLLLHPPADPHAAPLQVGAFGAPQLGQPLALVVAVDAPGRAPALLRRPPSTT